MRGQEAYMSGRQKDDVRVEYNGFTIRYNEDDDKWESHNSLDEKIEAPTLKGIKAKLREQVKTKFKPFKVWVKRYLDGYLLVDVYAISSENKVFYTNEAGKKDHENYRHRGWGGEKYEYNFFEFSPDNTGRIKQIAQKREQIKQIEKEIEKLQKQLKGAKIPPEENPDEEKI